MRVAEQEFDVNVRSGVVETLLFRNATAQADRVLQNAPEDVWQEVSKRGYRDTELAGLTSAPRLREVRDRRQAAETDLSKRLWSLVHEGRGEADADKEVRTILARPDFPVRGDRGAPLNEAAQLFPKAVRSAFIERIENGYTLPFRAYEYLARPNQLVEDGRIAEIVLDPTTDDERANAAAHLVGSKTVGHLVDQLLATAKQWRAAPQPEKELLGKQFTRLHNLLAQTDLAAFGIAILTRGTTEDPEVNYDLADLIGRHGVDHPRPEMEFPPEMRRELVGMLQRWAETLLASKNAKRSQMAEVARAVERLPAPALVPILKSMLAEDIARWTKARAEYREARAAGRENDAQMSYTLQYGRTFARIGNEAVVEIMLAHLANAAHEAFGQQAAQVLFDIWRRQSGSDQDGFQTFRQEFAEVRERRAARAAGRTPPATRFAYATLGVVEAVLVPECGEPAQRHALRLAAVAVLMPYGNRSELVTRLLAARCPWSEKL